MNHADRCRTGIFKWFRTLIDAPGPSPENVDKLLFSTRFDQDARENDCLGSMILLVSAAGISTQLPFSGWVNGILSVPIAWVGLHIVTAIVARSSLWLADPARSTVQHFIFMGLVSLIATLLLSTTGIPFAIGCFWVFLVLLNVVCWIAYHLLSPSFPDR